MTRAKMTDIRLGDVFRNRRERGRTGLPLLSVTMDRGLVRRDSLGRKTDSELHPEEHLLVRKGDIAYNMMRMWQGASGVAHEDAVVSPAYVVVTPSDAIVSDFAGCLFKSRHMIRRFKDYSYGITGDRLRLYYKDFARIPISVPPVAEQRRIADIAATWDLAFTQTGELLALKQELWKGLLQQLMPGRRRLRRFGRPARGFGNLPKGWREKRLAEVADIRVSNVDKKTLTGETPVLLCNYSDVFGNRFIAGDVSFMQATATGREIERFALEPMDVLVTKDSETSSDIASTAVVTEPLDRVICGYHVALVRPDPAIAHGPFLAVQLCSPRTHRYFVRQANGVTRFGLGIGAISKAPVWLPNLSEQKRIAEVLDRLSQEISLLCRMQTRLRAQSLGLVQRLLSGQVRV